MTGPVTEFRGGPWAERTQLGIIRTEGVQPGTPMDEPGPERISLAALGGHYERLPVEGTRHPYAWVDDADGQDAA